MGFFQIGESRILESKSRSLKFQISIRKRSPLFKHNKQLSQEHPDTALIRTFRNKTLCVPTRAQVPTDVGCTFGIYIEITYDGIYIDISLVSKLYRT